MISGLDEFRIRFIPIILQLHLTGDEKLKKFLMEQLTRINPNVTQAKLVELNISNEISQFYYELIAPDPIQTESDELDKLDRVQSIIKTGSENSAANQIIINNKLSAIVELTRINHYQQLLNNSNREQQLPQKPIIPSASKSTVLNQSLFDKQFNQIRHSHGTNIDTSTSAESISTANDSGAGIRTAAGTGTAAGTADSKADIDMDFAILIN